MNNNSCNIIRTQRAQIATAQGIALGKIRKRKNAA